MAGVGSSTQTGEGHRLGFYAFLVQVIVGPFAIASVPLAAAYPRDPSLPVLLGVLQGSLGLVSIVLFGFALWKFNSGRTEFGPEHATSIRSVRTCLVAGGLAFVATSTVLLMLSAAGLADLVFGGGTADAAFATMDVVFAFVDVFLTLVIALVIVYPVRHFLPPGREALSVILLGLLLLRPLLYYFVRFTPLASSTAALPLLIAAQTSSVFGFLLASVLYRGARNRILTGDVISFAPPPTPGLGRALLSGFPPVLIEGRQRR